MISLPIFTENMKFFAWSFLNSPKIGRWKSFNKSMHAKRGKKEKNVKRVFFTDKMGAKKLYCWMLWYLLFEHLWKTPSCRRKLHPKSEKMFYKYLTYFLDAAGWPNIWFLSSLSLSMIESNERCSKLFWNRMSMIDNRSFRPPHMYLEYLDTDKMRG